MARRDVEETPNVLHLYYSAYTDPRDQANRLERNRENYDCLKSCRNSSMYYPYTVQFSPCTIPTLSAMSSVQTLNPKAHSFIHQLFVHPSTMQYRTRSFCLHRSARSYLLCQGPKIHPSSKGKQLLSDQ